MRKRWLSAAATAVVGVVIAVPLAVGAESVRTQFTGTASVADGGELVVAFTESRLPRKSTMSYQLRAEGHAKYTCGGEFWGSISHGSSGNAPSENLTATAVRRAISGTLISYQPDPSLHLPSCPSGPIVLLSIEWTNIKVTNLTTGTVLALDDVSREFPPPESYARPSSIAATTGTLASGGASELAADDDIYVEVDSTTTATKKTAWYGRILDVPNELISLKVRYTGKNSTSCKQVVGIRNWSTKRFEDLDVRHVGAAEVALIDLVPVGALADYVSGTSGAGEVRVRVQCSTKTVAFTGYGDFMQISYTAA